jgi:hypothetical protein
MQLLRPRVFAAVLAMTAALASIMLVSAPAASAAPTASAITVPISGTNGTNSFAGDFTVTGFRLVNGTLNAVGTLTGTITNIATGATTAVNQVINLPVASATGTCQILHLTLGPLDLTLLGLNVHLNQVVLDITATSGPGNLLGNLLCGVAHLLDGSGGLGGLANLLNNLLARL